MQSAAQWTVTGARVCDPQQRSFSGSELFANDFHENTFSAAAVEFAVEDLFPGSEVELSFGDRDDDFPSHDLAFHVRVGIVLAGAIVMILRRRRVGREFLQPDVVIVN